MPRPALILVLLSVWLFAIFAPPLISIFCDDRNPIVSINLNEEEQQEQGKKSTDEKLVVVRNSSSFSVLSQLQNSILHSFYLLGNSVHASEIDHPPPELFI